MAGGGGPAAPCHFFGVVKVEQLSLSIPPFFNPVQPALKPGSLADLDRLGGLPPFFN
jgi:hypothetical protein